MNTPEKTASSPLIAARNVTRTLSGLVPVTLVQDITLDTFERDSHKEVVLGPVNFPKRRMRVMQQAIDAAREGKVISGRVAA